MHGRRLATTERVIAVLSPDRDDEPLDRLRAWTEANGLTLRVVWLDDDVDDAYEPSEPTLGVTLGGDGTFLEGVKRFAPLGVPQLGVNVGTMSFLCRVEVDDIEAALNEVLRGRATVDSRQQVQVDAQGVDATGINDVMIQHVPPENPFDRKVTRLEVFADGEYVGQYEGTGIAVATPTGSTGIALSAGGPVHLPADNHTLQIVPLHTHSLGVRPLVMAADTEIEVVTRGQASLLVDGGRAYNVLGNDSVISITGADRRAHVVRTSYDDQFMTALTEKLSWGIRDESDGPQGLLERPRSQDTAPTLLERARDVAMEAARSVGDPLRELHGRVEDVTYKTDKSDIVTEADHRANRIITSVIASEFPDHSVISEESETIDGDTDYTWVVDPVDGTGNFTHGNPNYAVSIALLDAGEPVMGVVYVPETDELFHAIQGGDAYEGDIRIVTTDRGRLDESMLLTGYDPDGEFLAHYYNETRGVRSLGSAALNLCYLASGSADALWEYDTYPWDVAAGLVIARAAGARITDSNDERYEVAFDAEGRRPLLGSNGPLHRALFEHLEQSGLL